MEYNSNVIYQCKCGEYLEIGVHRSIIVDNETDLFHDNWKFDYDICPYCKNKLNFNNTMRFKKEKSNKDNNL